VSQLHFINGKLNEPVACLTCECSLPSQVFAMLNSSLIIIFLVNGFCTRHI